ncbi:type II toxin-antitoxin system RelE/ParE family toxin [Bradyrhizobium sp. 40]|nr:type II toxin-antitoxin system RelE/ParE family toxin [Bradyrhizobium sp. 40]
MKVVWTREALADLADIATYYASNASPVVAEAVGRRFVDVVERVRRAPFSATRCAPFRGSCRSGRPLPIPDIYRVRGDVIHIVHIRHTSRRPVAGLNEPGRQYA